MINFDSVVSKDDSNYWLNLYRDSFPVKQQINFNKLIHIANSNKYIKMLLIKLNAKNIGILYIVDFYDQAFILYFAIDSTMRGNGLGKKTINALKSQFVNGFILESESIVVASNNYQQRKARYRFYIQNGLLDTNLGSKDDSGDEFHLLTSNQRAGISLYKRANSLLGLDVNIFEYEK